NNALPLDQIRLSSAEPFRLPWFLGYLGPVKASLFVGKLEEDRDFSRAKVSGWRFGFAPSRYMEFGFNRMFQFGGKGRPTVNPGQYLGLLFSQGSDNPKNAQNVNNVMSFDGSFRIPDVQRYIVIARDAALYFDFGWDDTLFGLIVPDKPGGIVGTYLAGIFGDPKLDLRIEYARTSDIQFTHSGPTGNPLSTHVVQSQSYGFDISYRFSSNSAMFFGYDFARLKNENRKNASDNGPARNDSFFRVEFSRSFGQ
ncbi:MAG: hypothetical protein HYY46_18040, partial [Deltaproteobacteria bacterium]|nr:hypothetical protein [Deltaproteobacteria bacterium]